MNFSDIPIRTFAKTDPSWWNSLRTAGMTLASYLGSFIIETAFTIANGQGTFADVTGLSFDGTKIRSFSADYQVYRQTTGAGATELAESGSFVGVYSSIAGSWEMTQGPSVGSAGMTFQITAAGQVQYKSTSITGTPSQSLMKFKARTMGLT